jgi:hypothetical protein
MKQVGGFLFFFGVGSIVLYFINMQFIIMSWVDHWGPTVAWMIRIAMAVVGGVLWLLGNKAESAETA